VFDKGTVRDGEWRDIDFKNTIIIMTSNAGSDLIAKLCDDPETAPAAIGLAEALRPELLKVFRPAFLGRVTLVPYFPLSDEIIRGASSSCSSAGSPAASKRTTKRLSIMRRRSLILSPAVAVNLRAAPAMSSRSWRAAFYPSSRRGFSSGWRLESLCAGLA
jgi:hypothetical protein